MATDREICYREILISPIEECASYMPKLGHGKKGGFSLAEFQYLYNNDAFYNWLGLDNKLMYSAHKAAGGLTSLYRQIGTGCERLVRKIFIDYLSLSPDDVTWSYKIKGVNGKERTLSLDGRILLAKIPNITMRTRCHSWMMDIANLLELPSSTRHSISGVVFEIRQGYKSKDSKRQNADIANAANAYANGYIPCLMVMSAQIDDDIVARYNAAKWAILQGQIGLSAMNSTFSFFKQVIGFDFVQFMNDNQEYFKQKIATVLEKLMKAE